MSPLSCDQIGPCALVGTLGSAPGMATGSALKDSGVFGGEAKVMQRPLENYKVRLGSYPTTGKVR